MSSYIDWTKTSKSNDYRGSSSFATFMIIGPTCFFLGILFAAFPYDFPLLWTKAPLPETFLDELETHLKFLHQSPPIIARLLNIIGTVGFIGLFWKLFRPSEANFLFDGASLILYSIGVAVYIANIVKGLRLVSSGIWDTDKGLRHGSEPGEVILSREDSLKVMAASNTILALVLVGVLVLQAGQWYAEKRELEDEKEIEQKEAAPANKAASKKKQ
ncbi:hypothetical protein S40288_09416 [Stachybotrys chartarum IBT 40288]|nr:hypothetical protein S40288_09416 [Stachybotrys chartarum IBT 40288]